MAKGGAVLAIVAAVLLLAGCASAPSLPPGPTEAEVKAMVDEQNRQWWQSIEPGEPMPAIEVIEYLDPGGDDRALTECMDAIPQGDQNTWERGTFTCSMQYPFTISNPEDMGFYSSAQLGYLYDYYTQGLTACLNKEGYDVPSAPSLQAYTEQYGQPGSWNPYEDVAANVGGQDEWNRISKACPQIPQGLYGTGG